MTRAILVLFVSWIALTGDVHAQNFQTDRSQLPTVLIKKGQTVHFLSPQPIKYVDISSDRIAGDIPLENLLRLKIKQDSLDNYPHDFGTVTVVGESILAQYSLKNADYFLGEVPSRVEILPLHTVPLELEPHELTTEQMKKLSMDIVMDKRNRAVRSVRANNIQMGIYSIRTVGNYIFMELRLENASNIPFTIDEIHFSIDDKKVNKATNVQSIEIKPLWKLNSQQEIRHHYRNIYVFRKVTFPGTKRLNIQISEQPPSGRNLNIQLKYRDILSAESL